MTIVLQAKLVVPDDDAQQSNWSTLGLKKQHTTVGEGNMHTAKQLHSDDANLPCTCGARCVWSHPNGAGLKG